MRRGAKFSIGDTVEIGQYSRNLAGKTGRISMIDIYGRVARYYVQTPDGAWWIDELELKPCST